MNVQQVPQGTGTGFVWDDRGHIVTNFHVIQRCAAARASRWPTRAATGASSSALFPDRDLAVLRIDAPKEQAAADRRSASSRDLQVGQRSTPSATRSGSTRR